MPSEALRRIDRAEKDATDRLRQSLTLYSRDNPKFLYLPVEINAGCWKVIEYFIAFAEELFDAQAEEYLGIYPEVAEGGDLLRNEIGSEVTNRAKWQWARWEAEVDQALQNRWTREFYRAYLAEANKPNSEDRQLLEQLERRLQDTVSERIVLWQTLAKRQVQGLLASGDAQRPSVGSISLSVRNSFEAARSKVRTVIDAVVARNQTLKQAAAALEVEARIWGQDLHRVILQAAAMEGLPPDQFEKRATESAREIIAMAADEFSVSSVRDTTDGVTPVLIGLTPAVITSGQPLQIETRGSIVHYLEQALTASPEQYRRLNSSIYKLTHGAELTASVPSHSKGRNQGPPAAKTRGSEFVPASALSETSSTQQLSTPKRRGRRPDDVRRDAICNALSKYGVEWRNHLNETFTELDGNKVPLGDFHGREIDVGGGTGIKASKWDLDLASGKERERIIDALRKYAH